MEEGCGVARRGGVGVGESGTKCGRWNPTGEQVKVLTELFRAGLRTPSTEQIQKISSQLSLYGKIESKNVFYWFQNHKARERQKRRRVSTKDTFVHHDQYSSSFQQLDHLLPPPPLHTYTPSKCLGEINEYEAERAIETLELFPLSSYYEPESESKLRKIFTNEYNAYTIINGRDNLDHPPLDLRLSFF